MLKIETILKDHNDTIIAKTTALIDPKSPNFEAAEENLGKLEILLGCFLDEEGYGKTNKTTNRVEN